MQILTQQRCKLKFIVLSTTNTHFNANLVSIKKLYEASTNSVLTIMNSLCMANHAY